MLLPAPRTLPIRLALAALMAFTAARAQAPAPPAGDPSARALTEAIVAEESPRTTRTLGLYRARLSHPQVLSASVGTLWSRQPAAFACTATCDHIGPFLQLEAGTGSAQLSAGYARVIADRRRDRFFASDVYLCFGVKGALLRTFGNTLARHRDRTYVGAEGEFTITNFNFTVGVFRRVSDEPGDDHWLSVFGFGWGF